MPVAVLSPAVLIPVGAYLVGSILPADIIARRRGVSLRALGVNPGAAETYRRFGLGPSILVYVLDALKGIIPLAVGWWFKIPTWSMALTAAMAVVGHNWSIYYGFWGGKGLATASGVFAFLMPHVLAVALPPSLFSWWKTRWVPATGIVGLPLITTMAWLYNVDPAARAAAIVVPFVLLVRQRAWIRERLLASRATQTSD